MGLILLSLVHSVEARTEKSTATSSANSSNFQIALHYEHGEGTARSYIFALQFYCDAANHGDSRAFVNLGWMYAYGRGVPRDDGIAVGWWKKAADLGVPQAENLLVLLKHVKPAKQLGCDSRSFKGPSPDKASPEIRALVQRIASCADVDPKLVMAVIAVESAFDPHAISPRHAMGLMQLTAQTAARFGVRDPFDPEQNVRGGTVYLSWLLKRFAGNLTLALAAYNAGENSVDLYRGIPPFRETVRYLKSVKYFYPAHSGSNSPMPDLPVLVAAGNFPLPSSHCP